MSIMSVERAEPFLTALRVQHGPRDALAAYFLRSVMALRAQGIELYVSRDVDRMAKLGPDYQRDRGKAFPGMDASSAGFGPDSWFTLEGRDGSGRTAFCAAARLLRLKTNFKDELESFRLFYLDPATQRDAGDSAEVTAPSAEKVTGFAALQGSFWIAPQFRGRGAIRIFPTLCRWYSLTLWDVDYTIGFLHPTDRALARLYREPDPEPWIRFRGRWNDDSYFVCTPRSWIEADIQKDSAGTGLRIALGIETPESKTLPSDKLHGKISRV